MWFRRTILTLLLTGFAIAVSFEFARTAIPTLSLENSFIIAAVLTVVVAIGLRLMVLAMFSGLILSLLLIALIVMASHIFFLEQEQDRWYANESENPIFVDDAKKRQVYLETLGIGATDNPLLDSLFHSRYQAQSALQSQQLTSHQVAKPTPTYTTDQVWQNWILQIAVLLGSALISVIFGCRKSSTSK